MLFRIVGNVTITLHTLVEAETQEEAIDIALDRGVVTIHESGDELEEWRTSSEIDGVVTKETIVDIEKNAEPRKRR